MRAIKNLIFIEDDELDYEVYSSILEKEFSYLKIDKVLNVDGAFYQKYNPEETIVLLDLNLLGNSGFSVFEKKLKGKGYITCIHTSSDNPSDITKAISVGIKFYFQKKTGREQIKNQFQTIIDFFTLNLVKLH